MENVQAIAVIIGVINGLQLFRTNRDGFILFCVTVLLGVGFGIAHLFGLTIETGIVAALASSGLYKVASKVGGQ